MLAERTSDPVPHAFEYQGSRILYWEYGDPTGRPLLMIHGFRGNHHGLRGVYSRLPQYRIIVPDLPGHGESLPFRDIPHTVAAYAEMVAEFITATDLDRPVLLGHSFGSIVAAHVAAVYPDSISDLILVNPIAAKPGQGALASIAAARLVEAYYWLGTNLPDRLSQRMLKSHTWARLMSAALARTRERSTRRRVIAHHIADTTSPQHRRVIAEAFAESITRTALEDAAKIHTRTLLVVGEQDNVAPLADQRRLNRTMASSQLIVVPRQGHLLHLEQPESAAQAIAHFIG